MFLFITSCSELDDDAIPSITGNISLPDSLRTYPVVVCAIVDPLANFATTHPKSDTVNYYFMIIDNDTLLSPYLHTYVVISDTSRFRNYSLPLLDRSFFTDYLEDDLVLICFVDKNRDNNIQWYQEASRYPYKYYGNGDSCLAFKIDFNYYQKGNTYSLQCNDDSSSLSQIGFNNFNFSF